MLTHEGLPYCRFTFPLLDARRAPSPRHGNKDAASADASRALDTKKATDFLGGFHLSAFCAFVISFYRALAFQKCHHIAADVGARALPLFHFAITSEKYRRRVRRDDAAWRAEDIRVFRRGMRPRFTAQARLGVPKAMPPAIPADCCWARRFSATPDACCSPPLHSLYHEERPTGRSARAGGGEPAFYGMLGDILRS